LLKELWTKIKGAGKAVLGKIKGLL
uniref:M-poneritoxin-Ng2b n=1 Tax=Neoponera goeldii TaxID=3057131 RepID=LTX2B_NEOGO|nr:RecName: Full=M-poneritoxin-Ng2b; Short=M-PONTX-Ng2b; AltName: Full=Poneratoxin; AltName: Full=Ponericin-L2 [Neoponera goeldii]